MSRILAFICGVIAALLLLHRLLGGRGVPRLILDDDPYAQPWGM